MTIFALGDAVPEVPDDDQWWAAPSASIIGQVRIASDVSVWFGAVLRGDTELITIEEGSNIQDGCVLHADPGFPLTVGRGCTVGHQAILHGCTIGDGSLIGMGATVLNGARVGRNCLIGAKALVGEGKVIPDFSLVLGIPGKVAKVLPPEAVEQLRQAALGYSARWKRYRAELRPAT